MRLSKRSAWLAALTLATAGPACAETDLFSPDSIHGLAEIRLGGGHVERSWTDGGFGKTDHTEGLQLSQAALQWTPSLAFGLSAVVTAAYQASTDPKADIGEAYLKLKAPPTPYGRLSLRAGAFYPPVSEEHDGIAWTTPDTISASALNSWVGEELKVVGVEATWLQALGGGQLEATGAVFGWDDTAGTLLTFRGWALHDVRAGLGAELPLPPLSAFGAKFQPRDTYPVRELDDRAGYYGRLEWRPPAPVSFNALYYDNAGNRTAIDSERQWAWETRFLNLGLKWEPSETTRVIAQAMNGETLMGYRIGGLLWFDMGFQSAFVQAAHTRDRDVFTGRLETFRTSDRTFVVQDNNNEKGWAATAAWRRRLAPHADLILEAQHISSDRPGRAAAREAAKQDETLVQSALRLSF